MKKSLIPLAAIIIALGATSAGVLALTGGDEPSSDQPPISSDEGIDPDECSLVHNITACDEVLNPPGPVDEPAGEGDYYQVTIQFNESVTEEDHDEVDALLRDYDGDFEFVLMEIFPPIGSATLSSDVPEFCQTVVAQLEAKSYVADASCEPWQPVDLDDPDAPVTNLPNVE